MTNQLAEFRQEKDRFFAQDSHSPLTPEQQRSFRRLDYFPENDALRLEVHADVLPAKEVIQMQTSTGGVERYLRYGRFAFMVEGKPVELTIFSNQHGFFLPFVDALAGAETYGAGRYLEPEHLGGNRFLVDFNLAYNPYCAYNDRWTCPITPPENRLPIPIRAGEKLFRHEE
ncbi:MAG: DUF1684 domain-containing protein [Anaerolineae bacterium]|nr:DUF1684 domain-containing protein [Anaerolineae bacterium]